MNPLIRLQKTTLMFLVALACFGLSPMVQALLPPPPPDGGYPNENTAEGDGALFSVTGGAWNTALGFGALTSNTRGDFNTATGDRALTSNTTGNFNTATGTDALGSNTDGDANTAIGDAALASNTTGMENTATGADALLSNTTGFWNTATGLQALSSNTTGVGNTATGFLALNYNTIGEFNTATGTAALFNNTNGENNTATGVDALQNNTTGNFNTATGVLALNFNTTGNANIALGFFAGFNLTTGDNNIDIGNEGVAGESNTIRIGKVASQTNAYIAGIYGTPVARGLVVKVDSTGHLGTVGSSERFKTQIKAMDKVSEAIHALKPVTFRYKKEIDAEQTPQFGLVAEDVEKVNPDLVVRDAEGKVYTVRYEAVNAMLLNEFLKEHKKTEKLEATVASLITTVKEQASQIQKVSAQLEASKSAPLVVNNL
jgi:Chaperone of endosialidase